MATGRQFDLPYSVELWDDNDSHVEELIALTGDYRVAKAAFEQAVKSRPRSDYHTETEGQTNRGQQTAKLMVSGYDRSGDSGGPEPSCRTVEITKQRRTYFRSK
jgi:hypothetical protein